MLKIPAPLTHKLRRVGRRTRALPLTLVSAVYTNTYPQSVLLTFNQDITFPELDAYQLSLFDAQFNETKYTGIAGTAVGTDAIRIDLDVAEPWPGPGGVTMDVGEFLGVMGSDGVWWGGVTGLGLPYP
jgi:hypothetical protein